MSRQLSLQTSSRPLSLQQRAKKIQQYGRRIVQTVQELNELCREFFCFINCTVFANEKQWQDALSVFKNSVIESAVGDPKAKTALYNQIEHMLLHPPDLVTGSGKRQRLGNQILDNIVTLFKQGSCDASLPTKQCSVCKKQDGRVMITCSKPRCKKLMHVNCATRAASKRHKNVGFYHCPSCQSKIPQPTKRKRGEGEGEEEVVVVVEEEEDEEEDQNGEGDGASLNCFLPACSLCQRGCDTVYR